MHIYVWVELQRLKYEISSNTFSRFHSKRDTQIKLEPDFLKKEKNFMIILFLFNQIICMNEILWEPYMSLQGLTAVSHIYP